MAIACCCYEEGECDMSVYSLVAKDGKARAGILKTTHAEIATPCFMPVGSNTAVKGLIMNELDDTDIILNNVLHLIIRGAIPLVQNCGGLHAFSGWPRAILTDSGGFQVFSMAKIIKKNRDGVLFKSPWDGREHSITPEISVRTQCEIGVDIAMSFDDCIDSKSSKKEIAESLQRSHSWAQRGREEFLRSNKNSLLFGIIQGGVDFDFRAQSLETVTAIGFDGYALGGLAVGECKDERDQIVSRVTQLIPENYPRYLMGIGSPVDILTSVANGVDMFDCVLPTRNARNGYLFTSTGIVRIKNSKYKHVKDPIDSDCSCDTCKNYSLSYLRYLFTTKELNAAILLTAHNVHFYLSLLKKARAAIISGNFQEFSSSFLKKYGNMNPNDF